MTVSIRRAAQQHLKRLLREASSASPSSRLQKGPRGNDNAAPSWSFVSARHISSVSSVSEPKTDPFDKVSCVLPRARGGLRFNLGSPETLGTRMTIQQLRGVKISGSEVKVGFVIERKGRAHRKGFKDATYYTGSGRSTYPEIFVDERHYTFLYKEDGTVYLMDPTTFEQVEVPVSYFDTRGVYLTDGMDVTLQYFDGKPLSGSVPPRVTCSVAEAEPYFKGQTATPSYKKAILENGLQIMTPTFISAGDVIVVDTTDDSYVTRSKT